MRIVRQPLPLAARWRGPLAITLAAFLGFLLYSSRHGSGFSSKLGAAGTASLPSPLGEVLNCPNASPLATGTNRGGPRVVVAQPFFREFELLQTKLEELWDVVDVFVVTEAAHSFTGNPKPLYFKEAACSRFGQYLNKIVYAPYRGDAHLAHDGYKGDYSMKDFMQPIIESLSLEPHDIVMISDTDEFASEWSLRRAVNHLTNWHRQPPPHPIVVFELIQFFFNPWIRERNLDHIHCLFAVTMEGLKAANRSLMELRYKYACGNIDTLRQIGYEPWIAHEAGWHGSWFMTPDLIVTKVRSFAHYEDVKNRPGFFNASAISANIAANKHFPSAEEEKPLVAAEPLSLIPVMHMRPSALKIFMDYATWLRAEQINTEKWKDGS